MKAIFAALAFLLTCSWAFALDSIEVKSLSVEANTDAKTKQMHPYCLVMYVVLDGRDAAGESDDAFLSGTVMLMTSHTAPPQRLTLNRTVSGTKRQKTIVRVLLATVPDTAVVLELDLTMTGRREVFGPNSAIELSARGKYGFKNGSITKDPPKDFLKTALTKPATVSMDNHAGILAAHCQFVHCLTSLAMTLPPTTESYKESQRIASLAKQIHAAATKLIASLKSDIERDKKVLANLEEKALHIRNAELDRITTARIKQLKQATSDAETEIKNWQARISELSKTSKVLEQYVDILKVCLKKK